MSDQHWTNEQLIERYIDGVLDGPDIARAEQLIEADAELRAMVETSRAIDEQVRRAFARDAEPDLAAFVREHAGNSAGVAGKVGGSTWRTWGGIAAAVVLLVGAIGTRIWLSGPANQATVTNSPYLEPERVYMAMRDINFEPEWTCADDAEFADAVRRHLGQAMLVAPEPGEALVGWQSLRYLGEVSEYLVQKNEMILLSTYRGENIVTVVANIGSDREVPEPVAESGLRMFKRELGDLVVYEITPLDEASVSTRMFNPDE